MKLAYVNLLWIGFTFLGLIIFGFWPATVAMFTVVRSFIVKEEEPIFKQFITTYKREWLKTNGIGIVLFCIGYILYLDFLLIGYASGGIAVIFTLLLILLTILYVAMFLVILPIYVHYDLPFIQYFKYALFLAVINPHIIIFIATGLVAGYFIFSFIPGLTLFFFGSVLSTFMMWSTLLACQRIERKKQEVEAV